MSNSTFNYRYETGWQGHDGTLENTCDYFAKKLEAMTHAQNIFKPAHFKSTYVYDRCLDFTRWYDRKKWSRTQPST
jgi:hypothetical protein